MEGKLPPWFRLSCFKVVSLYTNSHLSISTKPGKNYLTIQELATGFFSPLQVKLFLFIEIPRIVINTNPGKLFRSLTVQEGSEPG